MKKQLINYETLLKITKAISHSRDPEEVVLMTAESIKTSLEVKGSTLFLVNRKTNELELGASYGLSDEYINMCRYTKGLKGSIDFLKAMQEAKTRMSTRRTPYEGVPVSVPAGEVAMSE